MQHQRVVPIRAISLSDHICPGVSSGLNLDCIVFMTRGQECASVALDPAAPDSLESIFNALDEYNEDLIAPFALHKMASQYKSLA